MKLIIIEVIVLVKLRDFFLSLCCMINKYDKIVNIVCIKKGIFILKVFDKLE